MKLMRLILYGLHIALFSGTVGCHDRHHAELISAIAQSDREAFAKLLANGADLNRCDSRGRSAMHAAAQAEDTYWLESALMSGGDPNVLNEGNRFFPRCGPLHYAVFKQRSRNVKLLIEAGADVNHQDGNGVSVLRAAAESGNYENVVQLLEAGADPLQQDQYGSTVLDWIQDRDESLVLEAGQRPWFRKAREILADRGLLRDGSKESRSEAEGERN